MDREHIVREIARTAAENGGKPLGSRRFATVTGIRSADWQGKYWARWGDALSEAGFTPNELVGRIDDAVLLQKYAEFSHDLGRLPAANDLRLKHHEMPEFPDAKVFERLGTKGDLARQLIAYLRDTDQYPDVITLGEQYVPRKRTSNAQTPSAFDTGEVYLIKSGKFYKIGKSNSAGRRHYELSIQLPERAVLVHTIRTDDATGIEAYWHRRFESKRLNGEWFDLDASDVAAFKRRQFQ